MKVEEKTIILFNHVCGGCKNANKKRLKIKGEGHCKIIPEWIEVKKWPGWNCIKQVAG